MQATRLEASVTDQTVAPIRIGRPPVWTSETIERATEAIIERIVGGESLRTICRDKDMPSTTTVFEWLAGNSAFAERYARARDAQADAAFEEIGEVARKVRDGKIDPHAGRVFIDAVKWQAGKLAPSKYGDRIDHVVRPANAAEISDAELAQAVRSGTTQIVGKSVELIEHNARNTDE